MPIPITCHASSCGQRFQVKDELAGKKVHCPQCGAVLAVTAPEDQIEVVDDAPATPRSRRKRERRFQQKSSGKALRNRMLIIGGVLALLLVGVGLVLYFVFRDLEPGEAKVTKENYQQIRLGMSPSQVRGILGFGSRSNRSAAYNQQNFKATDWRIWHSGERSILVGFSADEAVYLQWKEGEEGEYEGVIVEQTPFGHLKGQPTVTTVLRGPFGKPGQSKTKEPEPEKPAEKTQ